MTSFISKIEAIIKGNTWEKTRDDVWTFYDFDHKMLGFIHEVTCKDPNHKAFQTFTDIGSHNKSWPLTTYDSRTHGGIFGLLDKAKKGLEDHIKKSI